MKLDYDNDAQMKAYEGGMEMKAEQERKPLHEKLERELDVVRKRVQEEEEKVARLNESAWFAEELIEDYKHLYDSMTLYYSYCDNHVKIVIYTDNFESIKPVQKELERNGYALQDTNDSPDMYYRAYYYGNIYLMVNIEKDSEYCERVQVGEKTYPVYEFKCKGEGLDLQQILGGK